jgi:lipoprotein signal peptidase
MQHLQETTQTATELPLLGSFIAIIAAANTGLIFGLLAKLSWQACLLLMLAVAALAAGIVFTVLEMRSLGKEGR